MRSCSAMRNQVGRSFQSGRFTGIRLTKARQVRRHQVKAVGEKRNQIAEHMPGSRKPVQQKQPRSARPTGLAIKIFIPLAFAVR